MECVLSFIIPSYNVEWCLDKAIRSMLCESCLEELEILVVDDGSTDRTVEIANGYVHQYPGIVRILSKPNGGHGSAINEGVRHVKGRYFKVVDADDWVITANLPELIGELKTCTADVVLTPYHRVDMNDKTRQSWKMYLEQYRKYYPLSHIAAHWKDVDRCCMFHGITYRTDFYRAYYHQLPEKIFYEDHEFSAIPFCHAQSIYPIDLYIYQYMVGNSEQSISDQNRLKRLSHSQKVTCNMLAYLAEHQELTECGKEYLRLKILSGIPSYYETVCIIQKDKKRGREDQKRFNQMVCSWAPDLFERIRRKSAVFRLLSYTHITPAIYRRLQKVRFYRVLMRSHRLPTSKSAST